MPTTVPTSSFLSSSSARTAHSSSSAAATTLNLILPALWASRSAIAQESRQSSNRLWPGRATTAPTCGRRGSRGHGELRATLGVGPQAGLSAYLSRPRKPKPPRHCCVAQCLARRRRLRLYILPPAPSWRPLIGQGASRWRPLIGPSHQAGRCRFEAASSATHVTATPPRADSLATGRP